jgi:hypothetical protein
MSEMLYAVLTYVALCAAVLLLWHRLTKTKEKLFTAQRVSVRAQTGREASREAAKAAEERCRQALNRVEQALAQTGQALEVAGHITVVSQQIHALTEFIVNPLEAPYPLQSQPGRHALTDGTGRHAITSSAQEYLT